MPIEKRIENLNQVFKKLTHMMNTLNQTVHDKKYPYIPVFVFIENLVKEIDN